MDDPLIWFEGAGTAAANQRALARDWRGSVVATIKSTGAAQINTYDAYGVPGAGNQGRFQFTGQIWLAEVGLYHYKARLYDPWLGRFLQTDPIGYEDQQNWYAYVYNDPVNNTDPTGKFGIVGAAFGGVAGGIVGGVSGGLREYFEQKRSNPNQPVDWTQIGSNVAVGALAGGVTGVVVGSGVGLLGSVSIAAATGAVQAAAEFGIDKASGDDMSRRNGGAEVAVGALSGAVGGGTGVMIGRMASVGGAAAAGASAATTSNVVTEGGGGVISETAAQVTSAVVNSELNERRSQILEPQH